MDRHADFDAMLFDWRALLILNSDAKCAQNLTRNLPARLMKAIVCIQVEVAEVLLSNHGWGPPGSAKAFKTEKDRHKEAGMWFQKAAELGSVEASEKVCQFVGFSRMSFAVSF